ncbi:unnamed protein product [Mesocestoides corti]|uniref:CBM21 domain-containing protein n=2 Tax=Mesocestoides corti TaxID=53468 RepID=A0A0R3UDZ7_MESCO|nr:unnamed protein product [Mesocestoides corti]
MLDAASGCATRKSCSEGALVPNGSVICGRSAKYRAIDGTTSSKIPTENSMVSELGRHWTGSMIELGYGQRELAFGTVPNWIASKSDSPFSYFSRRDSRKFQEGPRKMFAEELFFKQLLGAPSSPDTECKDGTDRADNKGGLQSSIARYLLEIIKEKAGVRHSLTSLLPTEMKDSSFYSIEKDFRHRKIRCRSCEPQIKGSGPDNPSLSSFLFECMSLSRQCQLRCPLSPPRKRLSLSDSEICYAKELEQSVPDSATSSTDAVCQPISQVEDPSQQCTENPSEQPPSSPVFVTSEDLEVDNGTTCSSPLLPKDEVSAKEVPIAEVPKTTKKCVRFADDIGNNLFEEVLIPDTSLPPMLQVEHKFLMDDDFRDMSDLEDSLPGVVRSKFNPLGPKHGSLLDIKKIPPPVPGLSHSNSSSSSLSSPQRCSPTSTPPTNCTSNWRLTFAQPAAQYLAFRQRLDSNFVSLENVTVTSQKEGTDTLYLYGTIKVKNTTFVKRVKLRVTCDRWVTQKDYPAVHNAQLSNKGGNTTYDTFMFNFHVDVSKMRAPRDLQFAVCYQAGENGSCGEYWDNNDGCNYVVVEDVPMSPNLSHESFFRDHPSMGTREGPMRTAMGGSEHTLASTSPPVPAYTLDYRPNFDAFSSLTCYSSWQHYSSESMYY